MIALALLLALQDSSRLSLRDVAARALAEYPSVAAARAGRDRAGAEASEAAAARMPRLVLDATATRYQLPMLVFPLHSFSPTLAPPAFDRTLLQGSAFATWTVFDFGQRGSRLRATRLAAEASDAALGTAEQQIIARAAAGYLRLLTARGVLAAQDQRLVALDSEAARTRRLLAEGKAARLAVLRVEAALEQARADRVGTDAAVHLAERDLAQLAQLPYDTIHQGTLTSLAIGDTTLASRDALLDAARERSPLLLDARARMRAAAAASSSVRATRFPELRVTGGIVDRGAAGGEFAAEWQAGAAVSWPVWTGGARTGQIRRADADARLAEQQYRLAELTLGADIDRALAALREARARVLSLERATLAQEEVVRIERLSLDVGSGTQSDYLDAEADLLRARASLVEARHAAVTARIELARITGELSLDWLTRTLVESRP